MHARNVGKDAVTVKLSEEIYLGMRDAVAESGLCAFATQKRDFKVGDVCILQNEDDTEDMLLLRVVVVQRNLRGKIYIMKQA